MEKKFNEKQNEVLKILMTPIKVNSRNQGETIIEIKDNIICSTQTYEGPFDEDMSDFAVGFYEILYKSLLKEKKILHQEKLADVEFAGDTMNSFNTIANRVPEAGKSRKQRTDKEVWPEYLSNFKNHYHCLANFWLLPMEIGRKSNHPYSKIRCKDYMDRFLNRISKDLKEVVDIEKYKDFEKFKTVHFLEGSYIDAEDGKVLSFSNSSKNTPEEVIKSMTKIIYKRAEMIANSPAGAELFKYFEKYNLIETLNKQ
jgi:hypothetical protein